MLILYRKILTWVYHLSLKTEAYDGAREDFDKALRHTEEDDKLLAA